MQYTRELSILMSVCEQRSDDMFLNTAEVQCPYCWQVIEISIDCSIPEQSYVEDCQACCSPMLVNVVVEGGTPIVTVSREND